MVLQLAGFMVVCEALLGIEPNKDLFRRVFEVKIANRMDLTVAW